MVTITEKQYRKLERIAMMLSSLNVEVLDRTDKERVRLSKAYLDDILNVSR